MRVKVIRRTSLENGASMPLGCLIELEGPWTYFTHSEAPQTSQLGLEGGSPRLVHMASSLITLKGLVVVYVKTTQNLTTANVTKNWFNFWMR